MKVKKFTGRTLKQAMNLAKADLGEDVIILETEKIKIEGKPPGDNLMIQITVAADEVSGKSEKQAHQPVQIPVPKPQSPKPEVDFLNLLNQQISSSKPEKETAPDMVGEMAFLRKELEKLNLKLKHLAKPELPDPFNAVYDKLVGTGIHQDHVDSLIRRAVIRLDGNDRISEQQIFELVEAEVDGIVSEMTPPSRKLLQEKDIIAVVGATGAGKTTSLMKLAIHPELFGRKKVVIFTTDTYRPAAAESLKAFSRITAVPVVEIREPQDIHLKMKEADLYDVILVDTPGRSPYFPNYIQELQTTMDAFKPTEILMTLSMTSDMDDLLLSAGIYMSLNPSGIILTKFDETSRPGKLISMMQEVKLPVKYLAAGQSIPNDMTAVDGKTLWQKVINDI